MSQSPITLAKQPVLEPAEDFYRLRREGIGFIEQMASQAWTDYNTHDPGITMLEALCYAITDLAYRLGWDIKDILAPETASSDPSQPYPNQAFFTARDILTVNPTTPDDFRRLLIDLQKVRNAWVFCKECACDLSYYAWCDKDQLRLSYQAPANVMPAPRQVSPLGLYEALLELEADPELGDLNDRKIEYTSSFHDAGGVHPLTMELRFPDIALSDSDQWTLFLSSDDAFANRNGNSFKLEMTRFGATKTYDVSSDASLDEAGRDNYLRKHWRTVFYLDFEIELVPSGKKIAIANAALRVFGDVAAKMATTVQGLRALLENKGTGGFVQRYRNKAKQTLAAVESAKAALLSHRNLDEDYCSVKAVGVEEVAVCADVEVKSDADIEWVQARIWFEVEQYLNPPIPFHTLQELLDAGERVDAIFNGPALDSGFIKPDDLEAASLKSVLRVSDIINRLMGIDGVVAVNQLLLTKYDSEGNAINGAADPNWSSDGKPIFDASKTSASWLLYISKHHQPRLYLNLSRFLFYKDGLPFLPRMDEASDTLNQLRGEAERPKNGSAANDLPIPKGSFRDPEDYFPVQYSFPQVYGIGPSGLPSHASLPRQAQAKQLKAYLMVFEQVLGNALAQLAHTADLFSLDPDVSHTYFVKEFSEALIQGFDDIKNGLDKTSVEAIAETLPEFLERRNRFLDHLLARFGEQFSEYALLLGKWDGARVALDRLIDDKISFLKAYPQISHDRAKAFDHTRSPCAQDNSPGIKKRISLLLGDPDLAFAWTVTDLGGGKYPLDFQLIDRNAKLWLEGSLTQAADSEAEAKQLGYHAIIEQMIQVDAYGIANESGKFRLKLKDKAAAPLGQYPVLFDTRADAGNMLDEFLAWSANERLIVVEHLLLRPKFPGDALYPACSEGACGTCGDEDPYSFRLTFVMPGWTALFTDNLDMRRFAELTIQRETPSHLLGKICWVGNDGFIENPCDEAVGELAELLVTKSLTVGGTPPGETEACEKSHGRVPESVGGTPPGETEACACAKAIYHAFSTVFKAWYEDKALEYIHPEALNAFVVALFGKTPQVTDIHCGTVLDATLWAGVQAVMVKHFQQTALSGWQFERFEAAWCQWLKINAGFDWAEERLHERVQAILNTNLLTATAQESDVCQCATTLLSQYGMAFYAWMDGNLKAGHALESFTAFVPPAISLCPGLGFKPGTAGAIGALLKERYDAYTEVSYRLWIVVNLLSQLRNTYPGATLHDCDSGSDQNPVRLDQTALGNYPFRTSST